MMDMGKIRSEFQQGKDICLPRYLFILAKMKVFYEECKKFLQFSDPNSFYSL